VPFAPESQASGIGDTGFHKFCWYEREFEVSRPASACILHFGAVDYSARVWVNGQLVAEHEGGHTPFSADITTALKADGRSRDRVRRGRSGRPGQAARQAGLAAGAALDLVSAHHRHLADRLARAGLAHLHPLAALDADLRDLRDRLRSVRRRRHRKTCSSRSRSGTANSCWPTTTTSCSAARRTARSRCPTPASTIPATSCCGAPERPTLLDAEVTLRCGDKVVDRIKSYTALRSFAINRDRLMLNGRPYPLRLVLDQGYWPESLMTAPSDEAPARDVELAKLMGFNGVRKHQKIEDPRYLYWADKLGLLVWEEMPSAYRFSPTRRSRAWCANGPRRSTATTATPASSSGCRSTNRGACRT
jgi:hypothetical protein